MTYSYYTPLHEYLIMSNICINIITYNIQYPAHKYKWIVCNLIIIYNYKNTLKHETAIQKVMNFERFS